MSLSKKGEFMCITCEYRPVCAKGEMCVTFYKFMNRAHRMIVPVPDVPRRDLFERSKV